MGNQCWSVRTGEIIIIYFEIVYFFHAKLGLDICSTWGSTTNLWILPIKASNQAISCHHSNARFNPPLVPLYLLTLVLPQIDYCIIHTFSPSPATYTFLQTDGHSIIYTLVLHTLNTQETSQILTSICILLLHIHLTIIHSPDCRFLLPIFQSHIIIIKI